jgi:endo-1,4-beta-xylanase
MHHQNKTLIPRRTVLLGLLGLIGITPSAIAKIQNLPQHQGQKYQQGQHRDFSVDRSISLGQRAADRGLLYGAAVRHPAISSDENLAQLVAQECNIVVPEWELKWDCLRPSPTTFDFSPADWIANFAQANGLLMRGHTLVWHDALPSWFDQLINSQNARPLFIEHIHKVVSRYGGKIHSWDVVNEAINVPEGHPDGLRSTPWLKFLGQDYIELAFRVAADADPHALLFYNDYDLDYDTPEADAKRTAVLKLLTDLKSKGTPIHGLGIQAHLTGTETRFNPQKFTTFLAQVADLGLKIMITEMDVIDQGLPREPNIRDRIVAGIYEDYLVAALSQKAVIGILNWGISDRHTWIAEFFPRQDGTAVRPLPFDRNYNPKLAGNAIARAIDFQKL